MKYVVGIDEVGRGALAGPVVVAAVAVPTSRFLHPRHLPKLADSKKLSPRRRESWYAYTVAHPQLHVASARVYQRGIDKLNISRCANLAASRALEKLLQKSDISHSDFDILLDGGLYLGHKKHLYLKAKTIIRGDQKRGPIKLASIVAKVTRDRYLGTLGGRYPGYGFEQHKGYGTRMHLQAIREKGVLEIHRSTFLGRISND